MAKNNGADDGSTMPVVQDGPAVLPPAVIEAYESMISTVPEAGGDGFASILAAIARAGDASELDAPWRSSGLTDLANTPIVVTAIRRMPSDYPGGLPWFLVIDGAVIGTGELVTITTGSVGVVAQLVKAWALDALPLRVIPRQSARPTKDGYYPQHLEVMR